MKVKVFMKAGGFLQYEFIDDFHFDVQDGTLNLVREDETLVCVPRENVHWVEENLEYDPSKTN